MQITKMSLANIQGKPSRTEMKNIMSGSGGGGRGGYCIGSVGSWNGTCNIPTDCWKYCSSGYCLCN